MRARNRSRPTLEMPFTVERGSGSTDYVCQFTVSPGSPGQLYGPPERCYPPEPPEVESKTVYWETLAPCEDHRFLHQGRSTCCDCRKVREERPDLEDLVSDEELLEYAAETFEDDHDAAYEHARDERRSAHGDYE